MKKVLLLLIVFIFAANAEAAKKRGKVEKKEKESNAEQSMDITYGARIGLNSSSINGYESVFGWQIGGAVDIPIMKILMGTKYGIIVIQPELMFVSKGTEEGILGSYEMSAYYFELPVSGSFKFIVSPDFAVRADAGPYFALGLFGKWSSLNGFYTGDTFSSNSLYGLSSRLDIGVHFGVAIEFFKNYYAAFSTSSGMTKDDVYSFYTTVGYNF